MGGAELVVANRKRKRKTRSERNHLLRHPHMEQGKHGEKSLQRKSDDAPNSPCYSLRSSKGSSLPATRDVRTCRTITQGRLTKGLSLFSYSKSSDCISRGPIPETASVKKKVEEDLKRIINPTSSPKIGCCGDVHNKIDKVVLVSNNDRNSSGSVSEHNENKHIQSSLSTFNTDVETRKINTAVQTASPMVSAAHTKDTAKTSSKLNLSASSSAASVDSENDLAEVLPVNEIADRILQNLKADFETLFPKRDVNRELNSDLQKLLRQSSKRFTNPNNKATSSTSNSVQLAQSKENNGQIKSSPELTTQPSTSTPVNDTSTLTVSQPTGCKVTISPTLQFVSSTQLICSSAPAKPDSQPTYPSNVHESKSVSFHLQDSFGISEIQSIPSSRTNQQSLNNTFTQSSSNHPTKSRTTSSGFFLPNACVDTESHDSNPIIINIHSEDDDDDDSDKDNDSGFAVVRYNAFLASARSLKAKLQQQNEEAFHNRLHHSSGNDADSCFLPPNHPKSTHCAPLRHAHVFHPVSSLDKHRANNVDRFNFSHECSALTCIHHSSKALSTFGTQKDNTAGFNFPHTGHKSSASSYHQYQPRSRIRLPFTHFSDQSETSSAPSNLAQSRHRLKTVLESTFSDIGRSKSLASERNEDQMDWQDVDILSSTMHHSQSDFLRQPLEELQAHQSDMQHQARNFLDDLERDVSGIRHNRDERQHQHDSSSFRPLSSTSPSASSWL